MIPRVRPIKQSTGVQPAGHKEFLKILGSKCREQRVFLGISQREIAEEINMTPTSISHFENGLNNNAIILSCYIKLGVNIKSVYYEWRSKNG